MKTLVYQKAVLDWKLRADLVAAGVPESWTDTDGVDRQLTVDVRQPFTFGPDAEIVPDGPQTVAVTVDDKQDEAVVAQIVAAYQDPPPPPPPPTPVDQQVAAALAALPANQPITGAQLAQVISILSKSPA